MSTMDQRLSSKTEHPCPYVWIKSHRLRNPFNIFRSSSPDDAPQMQGRSCINNSPSKAKNKVKVNANHKRISCAIGGTGGRMVKTADSNELFQTGIEPAYIDHKGSLIHTTAEECNTEIDETLSSRKRKERPKSSRTGWGVMLYPPPQEMELESQAIQKEQSYEKGGHNPISSQLVTETSKAPFPSIAARLKNTYCQKENHFVRKVKNVSPASYAYQATSSRPKSAVTVAVDRAWEQSSNLLQRPITSGSVTHTFYDRTNYRSDSRIEHKFNRRVLSAAPAGRVQPTEANTSAPVCPGDSCTSRAPSAKASQRKQHSEDISEEAERDFNRIRPVTVGNAGDTAKRYCEKRLQTIYFRRRSRSAVPSSTRTVTVDSELASPPTPSETCDQSEQVVQDDQEQPLSFQTQGTDERQSPESQSCMIEGEKPEKLNQAWSTTATPIAKFRLVVWITVCMRRLLVEIIRLSGEKTLRSATELQWMAIYAEKHDASLAFNKHLFSRDRVMAHVPFWAQCLLAIPPVERTEAHCRKLHALLRGLRSFDKFTDEIQMALCKAFILERVEEGRIVLKNGHVGHNFYFIYSGSVFVNQEDETKQGRVFSRTVATLSRGDSFGELALLQDIRRTATVSVRERCELLMVEKDVFASVCPRIFDKELAEKHAFIKSLDLFSSSYWSPEAIHALSMNSQIQEYKINKIIVGDSSLEDWIYICMFGKCQVIRVLSLKKASPEGEQPRKESDVVLSEEILQLLASATGQATAGEPLDRGDSKENLLSSLQLDYVRTSKKLYLDSGRDRAQQRALTGLNDATTLTAYIQGQREMGKTDLVYLNVGVLEAGDTFDLPSLLEITPNVSSGTSSLMLVSGGARLVRIKKAAFQDQASQQALDNARTLASKQANPTEKSILESYKTKIAWENFKASLVHEVKHQKKMRYQPLYRADFIFEHVTNDTFQKHRSQSAQGQKNSKIISALQSIHDDGEEIRRQSIARKSLTGRWVKSRPTPSVIFQRKKSLTLEDMRSGNKKELVISRRQPSGFNNRRRISKDERQGNY